MDRAKELFYEYHGSRFYMDHDGAGREYDSYRVSKETEEMWAEEYVSGFLSSRLCGKEARRGYSAAADLIKCCGCGGDWYACLYYPLRAGHLDDVTVLYMLSDSFRMAEKAVKKHCFSKEEADAYLEELDGFARQVLARAGNGTMTRADDYVLQEFSDPAVVSEHLCCIRKKWEGLFR